VIRPLTWTVDNEDGTAVVKYRDVDDATATQQRVVARHGGSIEYHVPEPEGPPMRVVAEFDGPALVSIELLSLDRESVVVAHEVARDHDATFPVGIGLDWTA